MYPHNTNCGNRELRLTEVYNNPIIIPRIPGSNGDKVPIHLTIVYIEQGILALVAF